MAINYIFTLFLTTIFNPEPFLQKKNLIFTDKRRDSYRQENGGSIPGKGHGIPGQRKRLPTILLNSTGHQAKATSACSCVWKHFIQLRVFGKNNHSTYNKASYFFIFCVIYVTWVASPTIDTETFPGVLPPVRYADHPSPSNAQVVKVLELYFRIGLSFRRPFPLPSNKFCILCYTQNSCAISWFWNVVEVLFGLHGMQFILSR